MVSLHDGFKIDALTFKLYHRGTACNLHERCVQVLLILVQNNMRIVSHDELIEQVWNGNYYTGKQGVLQAIYRIRQCLNDSPKHPRYICTYRSKGYRYVCTLDKPPANPLLKAIIFIQQYFQSFFEQKQRYPGFKSLF